MSLLYRDVVKTLIICVLTLLSEIFRGRKFRGSQKLRNFCIFAELNFAVHGLANSREFNYAVE